MIRRKGGDGRKEEKWLRGKREEGRWRIDDVTAPAITSDMLLCFYCSIMLNEIVSCKNTREKQQVLNERASRGDESVKFGSLINKINLHLFH